jgi:Peptidase family M28/PDZ domain/PA domain
LGFTTVVRRALGTSSTSGLALLLAAVATCAAETPSERPIERKALESDVRYLASDELRGRGNGTRGLWQAAQYIADRYLALDLVPAGNEGTYFQSFRVMTGQEIGKHTRAVVRTRDGPSALQFPTDFEPFSFSSSGEIEGPVVFVGYGITAPDHDYDDYSSVDVRGKVVLVLRYAPDAFGEHGWHATFLRKVQNAASHGARALLLVNGSLHGRDDTLVPFGADVGSSEVSIPAVHMKRRHADEMLRFGGRTLDELESGILDKLSPRSFEIEGAVVSLTVDVRRNAVTVNNVLGYLPPGSDTRPARIDYAGEHIIIGAHYDHLGMGEKGSRDQRGRGLVHNGADDNASGVAGLLELARLFSLSANRPRGILFAAFAGEELGLRGSYYYTENATLPLEKAVAMINLDMIGRLRHDRIYIGGIDRLPQLAGVVESELQTEGLSFSSRFTAEEASDHTPFVRAGVPALFFFTGLHGDYHKPTDDTQFINFEGMEKVLRVGFDLSDYLLTAHDRLVMVSSPGGSAPVMPPAPGRGRQEGGYFGVGLDTSFEGDGVRFAYVAEGGPAAVAGLLAGDVLVSIDGRAVGAGGRAMRVLRERRPGEVVSATVRRDGKTLEVKVRLASWP